MESEPTEREEIEDGTDTGVEVENIDTIDEEKEEEEKIDEDDHKVKRGVGRNSSPVIKPTGASATLGRITWTGLTKGSGDVDVDVKEEEGRYMEGLEGELRGLD